MSLMYRRPLHWKAQYLQLFFDDFDYEIQKISKIRNNIMGRVAKKRADVPNFYAREGDITKE